MTQLFFDSDGTLMDFNKRAKQLFGGMEPEEFEEKHGAKMFWKLIREDDDFFYNLDLLPGAMDMWEWAKPYNPTILTGCPFGNWAQPQKVRAAKKHFNTDRIITCLSREKKLHGKPGDILVDDMTKYRHLWEEMGGIFVHHVDSGSTLEKLKELLEK